VVLGGGRGEGVGERLKSQPYTNYKGFERLLTISLGANFMSFGEFLWEL
jgi:hypothetical protein